MKKKILVVEDEVVLQKAICKKLNCEGLESVCVRSVEDAETAMKEHEKISAVWLDHYLLGKETGYDFVRKLKQSSKWKDLPIFVVSNTASPEKIEGYMELGVNNYFSKADNRLENIIASIKSTLGNS